jgi:hypothetical protein
MVGFDGIPFSVFPLEDSYLPMPVAGEGNTPRTYSADVRMLSGSDLATLADQLTVWDCTVLAKPFDLEDLIAHVRACLSQTSP